MTRAPLFIVAVLAVLLSPVATRAASADLRKETLLLPGTYRVDEESTQTKPSPSGTTVTRSHFDGATDEKTTTEQSPDGGTRTTRERASYRGIVCLPPSGEQSLVPSATAYFKRIGCASVSTTEEHGVLTMTGSCQGLKAVVTIERSGPATWVYRNRVDGRAGQRLDWARTWTRMGEACSR